MTGAQLVIDGGMTRIDLSGRAISGLGVPAFFTGYVGNLPKGKFYSSGISASSAKAEGNSEAVVSGGCLSPHEYPRRVHSPSSPESDVTEEKGGFL